MKERVAVICPSRERTGRVGECIREFYRTSSGLADLILTIDDDDPQKDGYDEAVKNNGGHLMIGPSLRCVPKLNWALPFFMDYEVIFFIGDDCLMRTPGWDARMLEEARKSDGWAILYGSDGIPEHDNHAMHYGLTNKVAKALGYLALPGCIHVFCDTAMTLLGQKTGLLRFLPDVLVEHCHPTTGKAEEDATYLRGNSAHCWSTGQNCFENWKDGGGLDNDIAKLIAARGTAV